MKPLLKNWLFKNNVFSIFFCNTAPSNFGKSCIVLILIIFSLRAYSQNLVPNPSFEIYTNCPTASSQIDYATPWIGTNNSTDYYNSCAPSNFYNVPYQSTYSYQLAKTGNSFAGIWAMNGFTNYREYLQVQLLDTLISGSCYKVSFYVNLHNYMRWGINNLAAHFSSTGFITTGSPAFLNPNIYKFCNPLITDTANWVEIAGIYYSNGGEDYLSIGNFKDDNNTDTVMSNSSGFGGGYYYIDDVSIIPIDSIPGGMPAFAGNDTSTVLGDSVFIGQQITGLNCNWYDSSGVLIASNISGIYVHPTSNTFYVVEQNLCGTITYDTVKVNVSGVGVNENDWSKKINLYPNPSKGSFTIDFSEKKRYTIKITNNIGECVYKGETNSNKYNVDATFSNGIYILSIINNNEIFYKKIIIEK